jgi:hypothetical protein
MSKLLSLCLAGVLLFFSSNSASESFKKYREIEAYEIRPGILMMPRYSANGQVCEIGVEKLHYSSDAVRLDSTLSRDEIDRIFDELVPAKEKGPRSKDPTGTLITQGGQSLTTNVDYANVSIQIFGDASTVVGKDGIVADEVVAVLKWKNRTCR